MSAAGPSSRPPTLDEDDFDELFKDVWRGYPGEQPTPIAAGLPNGFRASPDPAYRYTNGSSYRPPSATPSSRSSRAFRPLPPTPGTVPRPMSTDPRHLPPAPPPQINSPNSSTSQYVPRAPREDIGDDSSSIYPGHDAPALPVYVKDRPLELPELPPAPSYALSQSLINGNGFHNPYNVIPDPPQPADSSDPHYEDEEGRLSPVSDLSYADSVPRVVPVRSQSQSQSIASRSPSVYPKNLPTNLNRMSSFGSSSLPYPPSDHDQYHFEDPSAAGPSNIVRRPTVMLQDLRTSRFALALHDDIDDEYWDDEYEEEEDDRFVNHAFLSNLAVQLRDKVPRGTHVKGSIPYEDAFTGKDIVSTIQSQIHRELSLNHGGTPDDRRAALHIARSLQSQLFFYEVEWGGRMLQDGVEDVYMFLDNQQAGSNAPREELPSSVVTILAKCYSPSCGEVPNCYAYGCPRKGDSLRKLLPPVMEAPSGTIREAWPRRISPEVLRSLPESEINRQIIIHKLINKEEQYVADLDIVDSVFIKPLRLANPPVITPSARLNTFIDEVFHNILQLRECNRRLLEVMVVRQREHAPVIQRIGDIFLDAATEFRISYPAYVGNHPLAERRMRDELENNPEFRLFIEKCSRQHTALSGGALRLDLRHFLNRPSEHLQKYPVLLKAILNETARDNPDAEYLRAAIEAIKNLQGVAQLRTFQSAMGRGVTGKWQWHDLAPGIQANMTSDEIRRQSVIFELVKGEMVYVKDLENIETMYIRALRNAVPPIIPPERLDRFILDVFHNFAELHAHHRILVDKLHIIQREEHPQIRSITAAVFDATLNFREAYLEYIPNYPIAAYRIDEESARNPIFKAFVENCVKHPDAHRTNMKDFLNCPIPRLLKYERLLQDILDATPRHYDDWHEIPQVIDIIKALGRETEPGVASSKQKVQLWQYHSNLVFKSGETMDLDLLNESRSLIHTGKLLRQPENGPESNGWSELFVLLFDNYLVLTKPQVQADITKYIVTRRPIPLDLLSLVNFTDHPIQRGTGVLRPNRGERHAGSSSSTSGSQSGDGDSRPVYPWTIHHNGRLGGPYILYAELAQTRAEWKQKLEEAMGLRKVVQESNKVFEIETLSMHTFNVPPIGVSLAPSTWNESSPITGKVTCSIPFNTPDGRRLVAVGCAEGIWIGFRHDSNSMRRVLHVKMVTQCTMLDDFGLFLVLTDKQLFAYHIEALVPTPQHRSTASEIPQKLSGNKEVLFFSTGKMNDRTFVIYMRKKGSDSHFHVLEPVLEKIHDRPKAPTGIVGLFRPAKQDWFKSYKEFFLPSDSFDLIFLKARIAVLSSNGFDIMDLNDSSKSIAIPQVDPRLASLDKRYSTCRPIGIFRSKEDEFLLCYTEFGIYVNRSGVPSREACIIEWEGTADSVAFHSPYLLLFDPRFIEIRHVETGRLSQIIPGTDVRCVWDGRGLSTNSAVTPGVTSDEDMVQNAHVHAVMNHHESSVQPMGRPLRPVTQHVFELIPTIPLYLPGSLASPSHVTYFPPSDSLSPPRSPPPRPSTSYLSS